MRRLVPVAVAVAVALVPTAAAAAPLRSSAVPAAAGAESPVEVHDLDLVDAAPAPRADARRAVPSTPVPDDGPAPVGPTEGTHAPTPDAGTSPADPIGGTDGTSAPTDAPTDPADGLTDTTDPTDVPAGPADRTDAPADQADPADAPTDELVTAELDTAPFSVLGITWDATSTDVAVEYRVRSAGTWTDWQEADGDVAPDANRRESADDDARTGTDPIVALDSDGLQVRASSPAGPVTGLKAVLVDPGARTQDATMRAVPVPGEPTIYGRALWGADESQRTCSPDYSTRMVSAAVHHTASTNAYGPEDVPGLLRGFLAYHTRPEAQGGRGWCDIGYNFLVDKFGRIFEGRAGGTTTTVVGVHTGGFNSQTIGVAVIGEYGSSVPEPVMGALTDLLAWKFALHGIRAGASVTMVSGGGASKYPAGTSVTFPTIYAHRDAQLTSCPGQALYDRLPELRSRVAAAADAAVDTSPRGVIETISSSASTISVGGWAVDPDHAGPLSVQVLVNNVVTATVPTTVPRSDIAALYPGLGGQHGFAATIPASPGTGVVCVKALNSGAGTDVSLGCRSVTVRNAAPFGAVDSVAVSDGALTVSGWALDPDTTQPTSVHVYVDGVGVAVLADAARPDVALAYGRGDRHGFAHTQRVGGGLHEVCVYAIDTAGGPPASLGCRSAGSGYGGAEAPPVGVVDTVSATNTTITVAGWAFDPNYSGPTDVHLYIDGVGRALRADGARPDVARAFGRDGAVGFAVTVPASPGSHQVCGYAIDRGPSAPVLMGCYAVVVPDSPPFGVVDLVQADPSGITVSGWTVDPDTWAPTDVHVYVDGVGTRLVADAVRPDVAVIFGRGDRHGFSQRFTAAPGSHQVCVYAINTAAGPHTLLGCWTVEVRNAAPIGGLEEVRADGAGLVVTGWTLDPDTWAPTDVHVYVDGVGTRLVADRVRPDIAAAFGRGERHGFHQRLSARPGPHQVCVFAINTDPGDHTLLGCRTALV